MRSAISLLLILSLSACAASPRKRFLYGSAIGAGAGALGGAALSPNEESKGVNALVFGLTGAVLGGVVSLFFHDDAEVPRSKDTLEAQDLGREFIVPQGQESLPPYVRERLQPVVIEEYVERDSISEDGGLSEPHKVWRIKRPAEFVGKPTKKGGAKQ